MTEDGALRLESLLREIPAEELTGILGRRRLEALHGLVQPNTEMADSLIPRYAVALDGARLLTRPALLALLLSRLSSGQLRRMVKEFLDSPFERDADNALALASKPLRAASGLTREILAALGLPIELVPDLDRKAAIETVEPYEPLPDLMDYQKGVKAKCLALLKKGISELLIQMPTGAGKTRTAMELVVDLVQKDHLFRHNRSVAWLAHTEELCEQAIEAFSSVWATRGTEPARVARLWGSYSPSPSALTGGLVVAGTSRMHALRTANRKAFEILAKSCAVVVVDEAHRALAPTVHAQISDIREESKAFLVGLSATPARTAEASPENTALAKLFGRNLVTPDLGENPIEELRRRGVLSRLERIELTYTGTAAIDDDRYVSGQGEDEDFPESVLVNLASNLARNLALVKEIESRASTREPAIVFCCSVAHADLLASACRLRGLRAGAVDCHMTRGARRSVIQEFSIGQMEVLLNYGVLSTGFDAPNVRTVVIARPTKSIVLYSQMLGRGLRGPKMGGTEVCTLVDVRDHFGRFGNLDALYLRFKPYWT